MARAHRRVHDLEGKYLPGRLPLRLWVERLADEELDERPVGVVAARLLPFLPAQRVDFAGLDLAQELQRLLG